MNIQQAIEINKLISDANLKLVTLQLNGIIPIKYDICFYMDTFRRNNNLVPYLTFRHNEKVESWNNIYMKLRLYFPKKLVEKIYRQNNYYSKKKKI